MIYLLNCYFLVPFYSSLFNLCIIYSCIYHFRCIFIYPIAVGKRTFGKILVLKISDCEIKCEDVAKLLGVDIEYQLNFDQHISSLCRKAGHQLNVLKRLSPF